MSRKYAQCDKCPLRGKPYVPSFGKKDHPLIAFVGEAPGENEVEEGKPFVGKAGQFLRVVAKDTGIPEEECYFCNTCGCRPDQNKKPKQPAVDACFKRLVMEIAAVQPRLVVTLGGVPSKALLGFTSGITRHHGVYRELKFKSGFKVGALPTYHPSGVLRGPDYFPDFADELEFAKQILDGATPVVQPPYHNYRTVTTQEEFIAFLDLLRAQQLAACDIETDNMDATSGRILCIGFSWERERAWTVDWTTLLENNWDNIKLLDEALLCVKLSFQNGVYDVPFLQRYGLHNVDYYVDTMLAHYIVDERQHTHGLERLAVKYYKAPDYKTQFRKSLGLRSGFVSDGQFGKAFADAPKPALHAYNSADVDYTYRLTRDLTKILKADNQIPVLRDIEMPAARMFMEFTQEGMLIDMDYWRDMARGWRKRMLELEAEMEAMAAFDGVTDLNIRSSKQMAEYLFDTLKLLPFGGAKSFGKAKIDEEDIAMAIKTIDDPEAREYWTSKRTQMSEGLKGFGGTAKGLSPRSTTTYMLYYLKQQHEFPKLLIEWKHLQKRYSMYYSSLRKHVHKDGKVHPEYDLTATRTGRKATNKPAMHNLPRGDEIYNIFIAPPGWVIIHADYKTAEMRMMCHYSGDEHLLHIVDTTDIHSTFAKAMFKISDEEWATKTKDQIKDYRIASKMLTFGIPYGRSAAGVAPQLGKTKEEAQEYIDLFFEDFGPELKNWLIRQRAKGIREQVVASVSGRKRRFPFLRDKYHIREVERQAGNFVIQATINEMTLVAHFTSLERLRAMGIPTRPWPHVHDSLNLLVPNTMWKPAVQLISDTMSEVPFETEVTFPAEIEVGTRWGTMTTVFDGKWLDVDPLAPEAPKTERLPGEDWRPEDEESPA